MACVADKIIASPFAVLGSIGVITDIPNVYERLKKEGIEFQTVTAGKYKRTVTPTKKVTKEDLDKTKADVEDILVLFRDFVKTNRPKLDIDKVGLASSALLCLYQKLTALRSFQGGHGRDLVWHGCLGTKSVRRNQDGGSSDVGLHSRRF